MSTSGMHLFIFGFGFTGRALSALMLQHGWSVSGAARSTAGRAVMAFIGVAPIDPADDAAVSDEAAKASAILIAAPPGPGGCPGLAQIGPLLSSTRKPDWLGYLSTTGVYGDHSGRWVFETTTPTPQSPEGERRLSAEQGWASLAARHGMNLSIFRLPGIYGPGRSPLDRARTANARRITKPGHVFSRIHVDDLAAALALSIDQPERAGVYNLCDDEPAEPGAVASYAAALLGLPRPPEEVFDADALSPMARRFWSECKRVSNAKAKAALGWRPAYPTYREGLSAILANQALS